MERKKKTRAALAGSAADVAAMLTGSDAMVTPRDIIWHRDRYAKLWFARYGTLEGFSDRCVEIIAPRLTARFST